MNNKKLTQEEFGKFLSTFNRGIYLDTDYLYEIYANCYDGLLELSISGKAGKNFQVISNDIIFYMLGEYFYSIQGLSEEQIKEFNKNESIQESIYNVVADKYLSLSIYNHIQNKLTNKYFPPISSIDLYVNLLLNVLDNYPLKDNANTLLVDLLRKTISIARCIIKLLCEGYDTEAFAMWRTLHECECVLTLLDKYQKEVIPTYIKHMRYGIIFRIGEDDDENHQKIFNQMKEELHAAGLKSKDTKKFIEYGWLLSVPGHDKVENFKLNFRDGVETLAGLHEYSEVYMTSSEILHGTPLLIYSNKNYFHHQTLVCLYESFLRIEGVFQSLFFINISDEAKQRYLNMKQLYFAQLQSILKREKLALKKITRKKQG